MVCKAQIMVILATNSSCILRQSASKRKNQYKSCISELFRCNDVLDFPKDYRVAALMEKMWLIIF